MGNRDRIRHVKMKRARKQKARCPLRRVVEELLAGLSWAG